MLWICLEEDMCLYCPNARWGGEFEWPKTLQGPQLENCRERLSFGVRKPLKKNSQTASTSPHVVWEGFKKNSPHSSKNNLQHILLTDTNGTSNGTGFYGQMKLKNELFSSKHSRWMLMNTCTMKYTAVFVMLWAYISAGGPGHLV